MGQLWMETILTKIGGANINCNFQYGARTLEIEGNFGPTEIDEELDFNK